MNRALNLPAWGPYSRHYMGISRIVTDGRQKQMIDFTLVPATMRGKAIIPDVNFDSGYHPWSATPDFSYYAIRYDLQDKDTEYCQAEYYTTTQGCLMKMNFVNHSTADKEYSATCFAVQRLHERAEVTLQPCEYWIGAENYETLVFSPPAEILGKGENYETFCHLNYLSMGRDGLRRGVTIEENLVDSAGLGNRLIPSSTDYLAIERNRTFLMNAGTRIAWKADGQKHQYAHMRCSMAGIQQLVLRFSDGMQDRTIVLNSAEMPASENELACIRIPLSKSEVHTISVQVEAVHGEEKKGFLIDGFLLTDQEQVSDRFTCRQMPPRFQVHRFPNTKGVALTTERLPHVTVAMVSEHERPVPPPPYSDCTVTNVYNYDLSGSRILRKLNNDSLLNWGIHNCQIHGDGRNHFSGYHAAPIVVRAGQMRTVYMALVCAETDLSPEKAIAQAQKILLHKEAIEHTARALHAQWMHRQQERVWPNDYAFSQERLMCNLLTNVTFPVYIKDGFFRTYTPGKRWGGLFTWDSGILGIGLSEYAPEHAIEILQQYFADPQDQDIDAVLHGTQLPLHIYLLFHLYQKTGDKNLLRTFYPCAKKYYQYFAGISPLSSYDKFHSGLLCPFEDGYNVEGIDDYPPQHYAGILGMYDRISPVCTSAHAIRTGKLMALMAQEAGYEDDVTAFQAWNTYLAEALQRDAWDERSGYFSYVWNEPRKKLWYDEQETVNFNMGIDGASAILTGTLTEEQNRRIRDHLLTEGEMWTPYGITSVDLTAPYARRDGYWNGKVWIPHQWFFYKALITEGMGEDALRIAQTALEVWNRSVCDTYNCYEQFCTMTGMGEGCHNFGGLSAPVAAFYYDLFEKGRIVPGFDSLAHDIRIRKSGLTFTLSTPHRTKGTGVLVNVGEPGSYQIKWKDQCETLQTIGHVLPIHIPDAHGEITLSVDRIQDCT